MAVTALLYAGCGAGIASTAKPAEKTLAANGAADGSKKAADNQLKPWDEAIKDTVEHKGFIAVRVAKDATAMLELAEAQLGRDFGLVVHISRGVGDLGMIGGLPVTDAMLVRFRRVGNAVFLEQRNTNLSAKPGTPMSVSLDGNAGHSLRGKMPVVSENPKTGAILVDATSFLSSDWLSVGRALQPAFGDKLKNAVSHDPERSFVDQVQGFPHNTEIDALLTFTAAERPVDKLGIGVSNPYNVPIGVRYSLFALPAQPMQPRLSDDRVGFFTTSHYDFSRDREDTGWVEAINRWRLVKKNPDAKLSEPVQPIVFYLDRSIPLEYRPWVRRGVENWNKAFERAGFKNAVVAKLAPDDPSWSAEDLRYSTIRWSASYNMGYAIGPSQVDPRTGEILNADVLIWSEFVRRWRDEYRTFSPPEVGGLAGKHRACAAATGLAEEFAFGGLMAEAELGELPDSYLGEALVWLTMHEVGHTLGLRHNYMSSHAVANDKLHERSFTATNGVTGSVMDYAPVNLAADGETQGDYYSVTVGPYDRWAIEFGYSQVGGTQGGGKQAGGKNDEADQLKAIAGRASEPLLAYSTDEDSMGEGRGVDPRSNRWDLGADPLSFATQRLERIKRVLPRIEQRVVGQGDSYSRIAPVFARLLFVRARTLANAVKFVGGLHIHRDHRGDANERPPIVPLSAAEQRRGLDIVLSYGFDESSLALSADLLNKMGPIRSQTPPDWVAAFELGRPVELPVHQVILETQTLLLDELFAPARLQRLVDNELRVAPGVDKFRLEDLYKTTTDFLWKEVLSRRGGSLSSFRRNIQRAYVDRLIQHLVGAGVPEDARSLARLELSRIAAAVRRPSSGDRTTRAHFEETHARIKRALEASLSLPANVAQPTE